MCTLPEPRLTAQMLSPRIKEQLKAKGFSFEEPPAAESAERPRAAAPEGPPKSLEEQERHLIEQHLRHSNGNKSHAAKSLGVSRETLRQMLKRHGLQ